jgi:hypothetical protein
MSPLVALPIQMYPSWRAGTLRRAFVAGTAWGMATAIGLTALTIWDCGIVCIGDTLATLATSVVTGVLTIGPLAALGRSSRTRDTLR